MIKGKILRRIAMVISLVMLITSTVNTTYSFIVTSTEPIVNTFLPEAVKENGLTLDKTIEHPLGEEYKIPESIRFDFKLELGAYYANAKLTTTAGELTADAKGDLTVTVKPGVTLGIEGLEEGTVVKVTEQKTSLAGFAVKGEAAKEVTIGADGNAAVAFINTYTPASVKPSNVAVNGIKILEGRDWQEGDSFSFKLERQNGDIWTELGIKTVTYSADNADFNTFDFSELVQGLTFDKAGTYTFRMSEIVGDLDNVDYDETVNHFSIKATDVDMDGQLEINTVAGTENARVTEENGKYTVSVTFNNTFVPVVLPDPDPITVNVEVNKTVSNTGNAFLGPEGFEFVLENADTGEKTAVNSDVNGRASFGLTYTKADAGKTFTYKLFETNAGAYGMTYDDDIHEIKASVMLNEDNILTATMTIDGIAAEAIVAEFENTYHYDRPVSPPTGDSGRLTVWFILMIVSGAVFVSLIVYEKKRARI